MSFGRLNEKQIDSVNFQLKEIDMNMRDEDFQRGFFESIKVYFETKNFLTDKQITALDKIYERVTS